MALIDRVTIIHEERRRHPALFCALDECVRHMCMANEQSLLGFILICLIIQHEMLDLSHKRKPLHRVN